MVKTKYPHSQVEVLPGDLLYSSVGKSTYFVGHIVIVGLDLCIKEALPTNPSGHSATIEQFWQRHRVGDSIYLYRAKLGTQAAANWEEQQVMQVKTYSLRNYAIGEVEQK